MGILWAVANIDECLLNDDGLLAEGQADLAGYEAFPRSAVSRDIAADLTAVSQMWLGSDFCARHVLRHTQCLTDVPAFWTREQHGEEASTWLLFDHKYRYLQALAARFGTGATAPSRAFCLPSTTVTDSSVSERILLLLAVALMESFGVRVDVCTEPEYSSLEGFAVDGRRAVLANWVGADGIWHVDTTGHHPTLREFTDAIGHARAHSAIDAPTPGRRLRMLADHLALDWSWVVSRCEDLGRRGCAGLVAPRSRLLSTRALDRACRYVGGQGHRDS